MRPRRRSPPARSRRARFSGPDWVVWAARSVMNRTDGAWGERASEVAPFTDTRDQRAEVLGADRAVDDLSLADVRFGGVRAEDRHDLRVEIDSEALPCGHTGKAIAPANCTTSPRLASCRDHLPGMGAWTKTDEEVAFARSVFRRRWPPRVGSDDSIELLGVPLSRVVSERDRELVLMRQRAASIRVIARRFGISPERVRQILDRDGGEALASRASSGMPRSIPRHRVQAPAGADREAGSPASRRRAGRSRRSGRSR